LDNFCILHYKPTGQYVKQKRIMQTKKENNKKPTQAKREKIVTVARHLFADFGFKDVSLDKIAKDAGVSKGAIFWHFENKLDLFQKIFSAEVEDSFQPANEAEYKSFAEKLLANVKAISNFLLENQTLVKLMRVYIYEVISLLKENGGKNYEMELFDQFISIIEDILTEGVTKSEFRKIDTQEVAYLIVTLIVGAFYDWLTGFPNNFPNCINNFMDVILLGVTDH